MRYEEKSEKYIEITVALVVYGFLGALAGGFAAILFGGFLADSTTPGVYMSRTYTFTNLGPLGLVVGGVVGGVIGAMATRWAESLHSKND